MVRVDHLNNFNIITGALLESLNTPASPFLTSKRSVFHEGLLPNIFA